MKDNYFKVDGWIGIATNNSLTGLVGKLAIIRATQGNALIKDALGDYSENFNYLLSDLLSVYFSKDILYTVLRQKIRDKLASAGLDLKFEGHDIRELEEKMMFEALQLCLEELKYDLKHHAQNQSRY